VIFGLNMMNINAMSVQNFLSRQIRFANVTWQPEVTNLLAMGGVAVGNEGIDV
jgi:hypothetical protein